VKIWEYLRTFFSHCFIFCVFRMVNWRTENRNCFCQCVLRRMNNFFTPHTSIDCTVTMLWVLWWKSCGWIPCGQDVFLVSKVSTLALVPTQPSIHWVPGGAFSLVVKWLLHGVDCWPPATARVKNECNYTSATITHTGRTLQ
jgi:hypothetical protein